MSNSAYVRDARPDEFEYAAIVYARAFVTDPVMNWMDSVPKQTTLATGQIISIDTFSMLPKHIRAIFYLHHGIIASTHIVGGRVLVTVRPEENDKEKIVSVTVWLPPRAKLEGLLTVIQAKSYRAIFGTMRHPGGLGLAGLVRMGHSYEHRVQELQKRLLKSKGMDYSRAWRLLDVATDPAEEGKGYCGKAIRHGLKALVKDDAVYLESSTPRSRDLYVHLGFEITDTPRFGVKKVTELGLPPPKGQKEAATGVPVWAMVYMKKSDS